MIHMVEEHCAPRSNGVIAAAFFGWEHFGVRQWAQHIRMGRGNGAELGHDPLPRFCVTGVEHHRHQDQFAMHLFWKERHGRRSHNVQDGGKFIGS